MKIELYESHFFKLLVFFYFHRNQTLGANYIIEALNIEKLKPESFIIDDVPHPSTKWEIFDVNLKTISLTLKNLQLIVIAEDKYGLYHSYYYRNSSEIIKILEHYFSLYNRPDFVDQYYLEHRVDVKRAVEKLLSDYDKTLDLFGKHINSKDENHVAESVPSEASEKSKRGDSIKYMTSLPPGEVLLGAAVPQSVKPGDEFTARFVACSEYDEDEVEEMLKDISPRAKFYKRYLTAKWNYGTKVKVKLIAARLIIEPKEIEFMWDDRVNILDFDVMVPEDCLESTTVLKFDILISNFIVGKIRIDLSIENGPKKGDLKFNTAMVFRDAFASYAAKDRDRVLDRVSEIQRNGIDVFMDCLSLRPGEEFKSRIQQEIKHRDGFMLFWSEAAKESEWVDWEWRQALKHKGDDGIDVHPLVPFSQAPPPKELEHLHFGDINMTIRDASKHVSPNA